MRCVWVMRVLCVTAAMFSGAATAFADPIVSDGPSSSSRPSGAYPEKFLYFSGFDLWRGGGTVYGGLQWAPNGLNNDGFTLKVLLAEGSYLYRSGATDIRGTYVLGSIMPGWRIKRGDLEIKVFAGLDMQDHWTSPIDPSNGLRGTHAGLRVSADLWWEPARDVMLASSISGSTIGTSFGIRGAAGVRVMEKFWTGPEIETSGDEIHRQYRAGAHVTSLKTGVFEWTLGAGYARDNSHRSGAYGRIGLLTRQ